MKRGPKCRYLFKGDLSVDSFLGGTYMSVFFLGALCVDTFAGGPLFWVNLNVDTVLGGAMCRYFKGA